ncbi:sensor histidine kinase [Solibacillus sp. FSL K6-4121]|uniref:sensor histidine kinase n=1 Tax=Solibacillus sp. FSL K6-4121 TaxID=2921505 RepID=UPI0030F5FB9D
MKIKSWLLITYLLIMIIPLIAVYGLYVSINAYYQDKNVEEYFEKWNTVTDLKEILNDTSLYNRTNTFEEIEKLTSDQLMITLYSANGATLYSSNPFTNSTGFEMRDRLYKNLYEFQQNYETFVYKEPVYEGGGIKGVYKITLTRTEWVEQVNQKAIIVGAGLGVVLIVLYSAVIYFLNIRLNRPVKQLIEKMRAYAKGEKTEQLPIGKDELGELTANFQAMQQEIEAARKHLEEEQRQKGFMIASLSHDLKTPLTSIQAYTESLLAGKLTKDEQQEYLHVIHSKSDYMKQLLDDLMMFTLLQSPTYELELVSVDGNEFFEMLLGDYEHISKEKGFHSTTTIQVQDNYLVHPKQFMRVMDNILSNAWVYTNSGGSIHIAAFEASNIPEWCNEKLAETCINEGVYVVIENSGATISKQQCEKMFEPLYQVDEARSSLGQRGAGLGLSIAKQIIEKHHGTIQAISDQNKTAIVIWLPKERSN